MQTTSVVMGTPVVGTPIVEQQSLYPVSSTPANANQPFKRPSLEKRQTMMNALAERGWPRGLTHTMATSIESYPLRIVVVDNSGSMQSMDGSRLVKGPKEQWKVIRASRWAELGDVITDMAGIAASLGAATHFHFLNPSPVGQYFALADDGSTGIHGAGSPCDVSTIKAAMQTSPSGTTPLTETVQFIISLIQPAAEKLRAVGQKVVVVLATDGLPNHPQSFLTALQALQRLPVWLVVRLCTDQDEVVDYWSDLDRQLEAPLETLDDVHGEAREVAAKNPWLAYAPSLHQARTMGLQDKLFDLLDEQPLLPSQAKQLIERLLGCKELPEPEVDMAGFQKEINVALAAVPKVYNPVKGMMTPWVDVGALKKMMSGGGGGCVIS